MASTFRLPLFNNTIANNNNVGNVNGKLNNTNNNTKLNFNSSSKPTSSSVAAVNTNSNATTNLTTSGSFGNQGAAPIIATNGADKNNKIKNKKTRLTELVESSRNLPSLIGGESARNLSNTDSDLSLLGDSVQLSLSEIAKRSLQLGSSIDIKDYTRAHYLLAGSGLPIQDVEQYLKNLPNKNLQQSTLSATASTSTCPPSSNEKRVDLPYSDATQVNTINNGMKTSTDLDSYLRNKKDESILSSIENSLVVAAKDFDSFVNKNFNLDSWEKRKQEVRECFGILVKKRKVTSTFSNAPNASDYPLERVSWGNKSRELLTQVLENSRLNVNENILLRERFRKYASIIHELNNQRQNNVLGQLNFPLTETVLNDIFFSDSSNNSNSNSNNNNISSLAQYRQIIECWKILENCGSSKDVIQDSKKYLERQFLQYVDNLYKKNFNNEGLPTVVNKIRSFVEYKLKSSTTNQWKMKDLTIINDIPVWALIYYLLRAGCSSEALQVAIENKTSFRKIESSFLTYLKHYATSPNRELPVEFQTKLHTEYNQHIKNSLNGDPYRLAVYKIIGKCDLTRKTVTGVIFSVEDWLWFHLVLITDESSIGSALGDSLEKYSLEDFQNIVLSYGVAHFSANNYMQVLLLSGLYHEFVGYVLGDTKIIHEMDTMHLIFGLYYYGKLDNSKKSLVVTLDKILATYISSFIKSDPKVAVEYILLLTLDDTNENYIRTCHEMLRELVLSTKEFSILLGRVNNKDGTRVPGILELRYPLMKLKDKDEFLHTITERAARKADESGRVEDSLLLYQLSEEYDIVISIVNKNLSDLLSGFDYLQKHQQQELLWEETDDTNMITIASQLSEIYLNNSNLQITSKISSKNKETLLTLLKLVDIWRLFCNDEWQICLDLLNQVDLIPVFADEVTARRGATSLMINNEYIMKNIPNLLILTMSCVSHLVKILTGGNKPQNDESKGQQLKALKRIAKNCMTYSGITQYKMSKETYNILLNLEADL
ncbi:related to Nucleoporin NIC96 [Saccharomycodes ludwigii]|uniref:Nuclear pore protein n=1 Tax=Saccharomycodes ludwigii TaxID=36035 RepID=A0A376BBL0_9ASCO|nr:related to Nucleoporin NIC96 [Saccharomycodes ludwigii]